MKKYTTCISVLFVILSIMFVIMCMIFVTANYNNNSEKNSQSKKEYDEDCIFPEEGYMVNYIELDEEKVSGNEGYKPNGGVVYYYQTAIRIAESVLLPILGDAVYEPPIPFEVYYDGENKCWYVTRGTTEVVINRFTGEIVYLSIGK